MPGLSALTCCYTRLLLDAAAVLVTSGTYNARITRQDFHFQI